MSYEDIVNNLFPQEKTNYKKLFKQALIYLNTIKLSRYKAIYFGLLHVGDLSEWKNDKEFKEKYATCCIFISDKLYVEMKNNIELLTEISLSILYTMLSRYILWKSYHIDKKLMELLDINDEYGQSVD